LIDLDDSAPASSETTRGGNDLSGLFAQPVQANVLVHAQAPTQYQQQQQPPSTYAPTPLFHHQNSNMGMGGGANALMQSTSKSMSPQRQLSGTPPGGSIALPRSKPTSQRSTPVLPATTPNYFGNVGPRGPVGGGMGIGMNRGMGGASPMSMPMGSINAGGVPLDLSGTMSGMSLNGGAKNMGMGPGPAMSGFIHTQSTIPHQQPPPPQAIAPTLTSTPASTTTTAPAGQQANDPFADLAGLF
jgi:hypothetical protein